MKTLLFDIETSPMKAYVWGAYDQNIIEEIEESKVISIAWKWLHEKHAHVKAICDFTSYSPPKIDDKKLVSEFWDVLNEADVVVAHNGKAFDVKTLNTRFLAHNLKPPKPYVTIDTKKVSTKYFRFSRNKLETLVKTLDIGQKMDPGGFELWKKCEQGDQNAWAKMKRYNKHDVVIMEPLYLKYRPWLKSELPNSNIYNGTVLCCTACGSKNTIWRGRLVTRTGERKRYSCKDCGHWDQGPHILVPTLIK